MQKSLRVSSWLFACMLLASVAITSCSGLGASSAAPSAADSMTLKVAQNNVTSTCSFPLYVAEQQHFFKAQGLTLNPAVPPAVGNGPKMTAALEAGSVELSGAGAITDAFTLSRVDAYVRILGALSTGFVDDLVVSKKFEQETHLTGASPLEDKIKGLLGKKIGTTGTGTATEAFMIYLMRTRGYDAQHDVTLVNVGSDPSAGLAALSAGRVDALSFPVPVGQQAEARGLGDIYISPDRGDVPAMRGQVHCVFYARMQLINAKPKAVQAFIRAMAEAETYIHKNQAASRALMKSYFKMDQKTADAIFDAVLPVTPETPEIGLQGYNAANQFHVKAGLIAIALPYKDVVASDTISQALSGMSSSSSS